MEKYLDITKPRHSEQKLPVLDLRYIEVPLYLCMCPRSNQWERALLAKKISSDITMVWKIIIITWGESIVLFFGIVHLSASYLPFKLSPYFTEFWFEGFQFKTNFIKRFLKKAGNQYTHQGCSFLCARTHMRISKNRSRVREEKHIHPHTHPKKKQKRKQSKETKGKSKKRDS